MTLVKCLQYSEMKHSPVYTCSAIHQAPSPNYHHSTVRYKHSRLCAIYRTESQEECPQIKLDIPSLKITIVCVVKNLDAVYFLREM